MVVGFIAFVALGDRCVAQSDSGADGVRHVAPSDTLRHINREVATAATIIGQPPGTGSPGHVGSADASAVDPGWWQPMVPQPIELSPRALPVTLESALVAAIDHSHQIQVFADLPLIRETAIIEAGAAFDWNTFLNNRWDDISEPIGNTLTAGGNATRFDDQQFLGSGGLRRRTLTGATVDTSQLFGYQRNNSQFFVPNPQGTSRLTLGFTQPLLRGRGRCYNQSLIVLAQIDHAAAKDEFTRQLQSHLLEVSRAYWALYLARASLYQQTNSYARGRDVYVRLEQRRDLDASQTQLANASATVANRYSDLTRARAAVANAQSRLVSLVNVPHWDDCELLPTDAPIFSIEPTHLEESVSVALQFRPEVSQAIKQVHAAGVRLNMSRHELMPVLNLVTQGYLAGLDSGGDSFGAFNNQFGIGRPSYGVGLEYQRPVGNRAARARLRRRQLEQRQLQNQYATTMANIRYEVAVAVREVQTSATELTTKRDAMVARAGHLTTLEKRFRSYTGAATTAALALENLFTAQDELLRAEDDYLTSQLTYNLSLVNLKKATGLLLISEGIEIGRGGGCGLPETVIDKTPAAMTGMPIGGMIDSGLIMNEPVIAPETIDPAFAPTQWIDREPVETAPNVHVAPLPGDLRIDRP